MSGAHPRAIRFETHTPTFVAASKDCHRIRVRPPPRSAVFVNVATTPQAEPLGALTTPITVQFVPSSAEIETVTFDRRVPP